IDRGDGEAIRALVEGHAGVARHLVPRDLVALGLGEQALPEIAVLDGLLLRVPPAVGAPALVPTIAEAVDEIGAVAVQRDEATAGHGAQALEGGAELHALVGGGGLAAGDLALGAAVDDDGAPAARPGVAQAGAVGVDRDDVGYAGQ